MKKMITISLVAVFFCAAMPADAGHYYRYRRGGADPAALGIVMGGLFLLIGVPLYIASKVRGKAIEAKKDVDIEHIKASAASGAKISCGDKPCENSYVSSTAGSAVVRHVPIAIQPIAQNVRPLVSHKNASHENVSNGGESALCQEGRRAAQLGINADATCAGVRDDYCDCYKATQAARR